MKSKKTTQLPNKVYYPKIDDTYSVISYYEKPDDKNVKKIKIPTWLSELISFEVVNESEKAVDEFKQEVFEMFKPLQMI
jgi:hypothetical protein